MSDIVDIIDSTNNNGKISLLIVLKNEKFRLDPLNLNVDSDSDESGETPFQRLIRLHASHSNYNERLILFIV